MPIQVAIATAVSAAVVLGPIKLNIHNQNPFTQWQYGISGNGTITNTVEFTLDDIDRMHERQK